MGSSVRFLDIHYSDTSVIMRYTDFGLISFSVGSFDIMKWVVAAMLVSIGKDYESPEVFKYMASISGSIGCEERGSNLIVLLEFELIRNQNSPTPTGSQATQTSTKTPLPATLSSWISQTTPDVFSIGSTGNCHGDSAHESSRHDHHLHDRTKDFSGIDCFAYHKSVLHQDS